jgi:hypothetical protein
MAAGTHGLIVPLATPTSTDFVSFYAAGSLADAGTPQLAYDRAEHYAAEERATAAGINYNFFYYPPPYLLLCALLAHLPYIAAFVIFEAATLGLYLLVARRILGDRDPVILVCLLAFPPVLWSVGPGAERVAQRGPLGRGNPSHRPSPALARLFFGALCYPHFGLLVPVPLAAVGHFRAFAVAFSSAAALCLLSLALFGWETWSAYLAAAAASPAIYQSGRIAFSGFVNAFGGVLLLGGTPMMAYAAQGATILAAGLLAGYVWHARLPLPIRAATLAAATLAAAPVVLFYDLMLAALAALWLLRAGGAYRLAEWEKIALAGLFLLALKPRSIADMMQVPIGPLVTLGFAALVAAHAVRALGRQSGPLPLAFFRFARGGR